MAASLNRVMLIGNLGRDPEIRTTSDGKEIVSFSLATTDTWKDKNTGEKKEKTEWHRVVVFNEAIVYVVKNYVKKGSKIFVEGSLQTRKWNDNSGQEKFTTEVVLQSYNANIILLDPKPKNSERNDTSNNSSKERDNSLNYNSLDDDIPF